MKTFNFMQVLSISSGMMCTPNYAELEELRDYMLEGMELTRNRSRDGNKLCCESIRKQFPKIAAIPLAEFWREGMDRKEFLDRIHALIQIYGDKFEVKRIK